MIEKGVDAKRARQDAGAHGGAVDRLGTGAFYDALLDILGTAAPHDLAALVRFRGRLRLT